MPRSQTQLRHGIPGVALGPSCPGIAGNAGQAQSSPAAWALTWQQAPVRAMLLVTLPSEHRRHATQHLGNSLPFASILGSIGGWFGSKPSTQAAQADPAPEAPSLPAIDLQSSSSSAKSPASAAEAGSKVGMHRGGVPRPSQGERDASDDTGEDSEHGHTGRVSGSRGKGGRKARRERRRHALQQETHAADFSKPGRGANAAAAAAAAGAGLGQGQQGNVPLARAAEEDDDSGDTTEPFDVLRNIDRRGFRLFCSGCHKDTHKHDTTAVECNGCHRWFHANCHQTHHAGQAAPTNEQMEGESQEPWYHNTTCRKVLQSLVQRAGRGLVPLPALPPSSKPRLLPFSGPSDQSGVAQGSAKGAAEGKEQEQRSWRLIYCQGTGAMGQVALGQVHQVLSSDWAYTMQDIRSFDFAALLKVPGSPACAALLDVYGPDVAELFVVSTAPRYRGQGMARELVLGGIAPALADAGVRRLAVSVDEGDEAGATLWGGYGFSPLQATELRRLAWQLPNFSRDATDGTVYYALDLSKRGPGGRFGA